jgi:hypothetical protein
MEATDPAENELSTGCAAGAVIRRGFEAVGGSVDAFAPSPRTIAQRPRIVCLCGSTRFLDAFDQASVRETLAGRIVLSIASTRRSDSELLGAMPAEQAEAVLSRLADLHAAKIDLADELLVLNVNGYIGSSTRAEIEYARSRDKPIRYLVPTTREGDSRTPGKARPQRNCPAES